MATTIITKNGTTGTPTGLADGELAVDRAAGKLWVGHAGGVTPLAGGGTVLPGTADGQTLRWEADSSEWQASSALVVDDVGNVGIGATAPIAKMQSTVNGAALPNSDSVGLFIKDSGNVVGEGAWLSFGSYSDAGSVGHCAIGNEQLNGTDKSIGSMRFMTRRDYNDIDMQEAMRIKYTGHVGIGTTDPQWPLHVVADDGTVPDVSVPKPGSPAFCIEGGAGNTVLNLVNNNPSLNKKINISFDSLTTPAIGRIQYDLAANSMNFNVNLLERMRIDTAGNVGIGRTPTVRRLEVDALSEIVGTFYSTANARSTLAFVDDTTANDNTVRFGCEANAAIFWAGGAERMRINSAGNLLVGTSSPGTLTPRLHVRAADSAGANNAVQFADSAGAELFAAKSDGLLLTGIKASSPYNRNIAGRVVHVSSNGTLSSQASTRRVKEEIAAMGDMISTVLQLSPVNFKYKTGGGIRAGLIAEDVAEIGLEQIYSTDEEGLPDAVDYGGLSAVLVKAIQEQQAMLVKLTARLEALEA